MIYLVLLLVILLGVVRYDFSMNKPHHKEVYYNYILLFFILMSGLSYKVGSDINAYMAEFSIMNYDTLIGANLFLLANKQPLWLLFENICKTIADNFAFMKLVISIFVCITFFRFYRTCTLYRFSALLAYFFMMSFDVNFNILRQSISIAFFLMAYMCMIKEHYKFAYFYIFLAIMFHNSAIVLLIIPLLSRVRLEKRYMLYWIIFLTLSLGLVFGMSYSGLLQGVTLLVQSDDFNNFAEIYDSNEYGTSSVNLFSVVFYVVIYSVVYYYMIKLKYSNYLIWMFLFYTFFFFLSYGIPIFGRVKLYFTPFYIIALINLIYDYRKSIRLSNYRNFLTLFLMLLFMFPSIKYFFVKNPRYNDLQLVQYYPYHSIIDMGVEPKRENLFPANY